MPILLMWVVPYLAAGGVMWFVSMQMAPIGREIRLSQAVVAVIVMGLCSVASRIWLAPLIGGWRFLAEFAAWTIVVKLALDLSFWRSLLAVVIYCVVMVGAVVAISMGAKPMKQSLNLRDDSERCGAVLSGSMPACSESNGQRS